MRELLRKYRRAIAFLLSGGISTAFNFIVYFLLTRSLSMGVVWANILSWMASLFLSFWLNRRFVFHGEGNLWKDLLLFSGSRSFSCAVETFSLWLFVDVLACNDWVVKILLSVVLVIMNYLFGILIFRKKE